METPTPPTPRQPDEPDLDEQEAAEVEDFDAWRAQQKAKRGTGRRVRVFGRVVTLPTSMPLGLTISMDTLSDSSDLKDVQHVVGELYGKGALDHWIKQGVDLDEFQVLMAWGVASANGQRITLDEAAALVAGAAKKATTGKAQGRKKPKRKR
ncbi:MAG: hypothetical protein ACRDJ5_07925 [Actinomycetota bacterium]